MILFPIAAVAAGLAAVAPAAPEGPAPSAVPAPAPTSLQDDLAIEEAPVTEEDAEKAWSGSVTVGASTSSGNNDTTAANANANAIYANGPDSLELGLSWLYNETNGIVTQRRTQGTAQYDRSLSEDLYAYVKGGAMKDQQADIDLRYDIGAGLGHQFTDNDHWNIAGEAGLSYFDENYISGGGNSYLAARLAYHIDYESGKNWSLGHKGELFPSLENSDEGYMNFDTRFKTELTETMFAQLQWLFNYNKAPAPGTKKEDNIFLLTVGWTF